MDIFHEYAAKTKESVWGPFMNLLNRQDSFIVNMDARIIAKIACWSNTQMNESDLNFYLTWIKDQLRYNVTINITYILYLYLLHTKSLKIKTTDSIILRLKVN